MNLQMGSRLYNPSGVALHTEFLALKHEGRILGHSCNPVHGFSVMEQVILCAVWLGSSLNQIQGLTTGRESYSRAFELGPLTEQWQDRINIQ